MSNPSAQVDYTVSSQLVRGYPPSPQVTNIVGVNNGQTIAGSLTISAEMRYAGLSQVVFSIANPSGAEVYSSTLAYASTDYGDPYCLGNPTGSCNAWDSSIVPDGVYTLTVTAYDKRLSGGPQSDSLSRTSVRIDNTIESANLVVSKSAANDPAALGEPLTYTVTLLNLGPDPASEVSLQDTLPATVIPGSANGPFTFCSAPEALIPTDSTPLNDTLIVPATWTLQDLNVAIEASHTWVGDLSFTLERLDSGTSVTIVDQPGVPAINSDGCSGDDMNVILSDEALLIIEDDCNDGPGQAYIDGEAYRPNNPLSTFDGQSLGGTWQLTVVDHFPALDDGTLHRWCLMPTIPSLGTNDPLAFTLVGTPASTGPIANVVRTGGDEFDPELGNNIFTETTFVTTPDLTLSKQAQGAAVVSGQPLTYTIVVTNNGPGTAHNLQVEDALSPDVTFVSSTPGSPACVEAAGLVSCNLGDLAQGASTSVMVVAMPATTGFITNTALVDASPADQNPADNSVVITTPVGLVDVAISKDEAVEPVDVGQTIVYTLTILNVGPEPVPMAVISDTLPAETVFNSVTPGGPTCSANGNAVSCTFANLPPGGSETVVIRATPTQPGLIHNAATVSANQTDLNPANNTATETTLVEPTAYQGYIYSVAKDDNILRVVNPADGSTVSSVAMNMAGESARQANGLAMHPGTGELYALLRLDGQQGRELARIDPVTGVATSIGNTGVDNHRFSSLAFDSDGTLYAVTGDGSIVDPQTLFTLSLVDGTPTAVMQLGKGSEGEAIGYHFDNGLLYHVSGYGAQNSPSGEIFEAVDPNAQTLTPITLSGADYFGSNALLYEGEGVFLLADCGQGGADACTQPFDSGLYRLTEGGFAVKIGNLDHISKGLASGSDLVVSQADSADPLLPGEPLTYTIMLRNAGYFTAPNVVLTDTLPGSVAFSAVTPGGPVCGQAGGQVTCNLGDMARNESQQVTIVVVPSLTTTIFNTVTVHTDWPDPNPANNTAIESTRVWDGSVELYLPIVAK